MNRTRRLVLAGAYSIIVVALSLWPSPDLPAKISHGDLLVHFMLYAILTFIWLDFGLHWTLVVPAVTLLGLDMEAVQIIVPGRSFSVDDVLVNTFGAVFAVLLYVTWRKYWS